MASNNNEAEDDIQLKENMMIDFEDFEKNNAGPDMNSRLSMNESPPFKASAYSNPKSTEKI